MKKRNAIPKQMSKNKYKMIAHPTLAFLAFHPKMKTLNTLHPQIQGK